MLSKELCLQAVKSFRAKYGIEATDENIIAAVHLMNKHGIDVHAALDQSSRNGNDHGIDAWYYDETKEELFVYQSKLTESKNLALRGLADLAYARQLLEQVIIEGEVDKVPNDNHSLYNLYVRLAGVRKSLQKINFILLSVFSKNEMEDYDEYQQFERELAQSKLNQHMWKNLDGKLAAHASEYNLDHSIPDPDGIKKYPINTFPNAQINLRNNAHLDLAYVLLYSLVELYRQRGNTLFDKNVRLSLMNTKETKDRLVNPMETTLDLITTGKISPNIFPFYHIGVTISAAASTAEKINLLSLEAPSIINGCQTITIANEYLKRLERAQNEQAIELFKQIKVIAKVVVGTSNEELKEITNSNNRQNPIENWQLFSNEPVHIEIEAALKDVGIFYERQKGKFDSTMKSTEYAQHFFATNGTYIRVVDLGQIIALCHKNLQWAAKPSEIFLKKENHDQIFNHSIPKYTKDIIFASNVYRALRRGLNSYLLLPTHANGYAAEIFKKQLIRFHVYYLAMLHFYQNENKAALRFEFSRNLNKIASTKLVDEAECFYQKVVTKTKNWYIEESKTLTKEVSKRRTDSFFESLAIELGLQTDGPIPFMKNSINWTGYKEG